MAAYTTEQLLAAAAAYNARVINDYAKRQGLGFYAIRARARIAERRGLAVLRRIKPGPRKKDYSSTKPRRLTRAIQALRAGVHYAEFAEREGVDRTTGLYWYRMAADMTGLPLVTHRPLSRTVPAGMIDTGLRIFDQTGELLHPDGRRQPAPFGLWRDYVLHWHAGAGQFLLLRPGPGYVAPPEPPSKPVKYHPSFANRQERYQRMLKMYNLRIPVHQAASSLGVSRRSIQRFYQAMQQGTPPQA